MNFDSIGTAMGLLFDELKNDKKSKALIKKMDEAEGDDELKKGLVEGVKRLRELGKNTLADEIVSKTKGFAF
jgi:hypothetical protein